MEINADGLLVLKSSGWAKFSINYPDEPKYSVTGANSQVVTIQMANGERVYSEPGSMMYMSGNTSTSTECSGCFSRCMAGESCCSMIYDNPSPDLGFIGLTPNFPSKVVPIELTDKHVNGSIICKQGVYMAHYGNVEIVPSYTCNPFKACCGGAGFVQQNIEGNGTVFINATGTIMQKVLGEGEIILVDTNCVLAWAKGVQLELKSAGGCCGVCCGGEGFFNTEFTGPGLVMVQSFGTYQFRTALAPRPNTIQKAA